MSKSGNGIGIVGQTIKDLLPTVNEGFNWDVVKNRFDPDPIGKAMSLHFTEESGEQPIEEIYLGIAEGAGGEPELVVLDGVGDGWDYLGAVITYQDYGLNILDPNSDMDATIARYSHGGVRIEAGEGKSKEQVWMVVSKVLDIMLESHIHVGASGGSD